MLKGKTIIIGVSGSIAAYKMANLTSMLKKLNANIHVIMTKNATNFINPIVFETLTGNKCIIDTFDRDFEYDVKHVSLAEKADVMLVAPATANIIGKIANGIADDMLSTTVMTMTCPIIIAPAMNTRMYNQHVLKNNLAKLEEQGKIIIEPDKGYLACGEIGDGKLPSEQVMLDFIIREIAYEKDLAGKKVLVTAGPTQEDIDPVRYITNHSSGKMGYSIAKQAAFRGADVTLISGPVSLDKPLFVNVIYVKSADDMFNAVKEYSDDADFIIKAAAVADYTPSIKAENKIKKSGGKLNIDLKRTEDILEYIGKNKKSNQVICGFSMETENVLENSKNKLIKKKVDMIAANSLNEVGAGFQSDTNHLILITEDDIENLPMMNKSDVASALLSKINLLWIDKNQVV